MEQLKTKRQRKQHGIHYTPEPLAQFLARQTWSCYQAGIEDRCSDGALTKLRLLDPACGDGRLLAALVAEIGQTAEVEVFGYETDLVAADQAREQLDGLGVSAVSIQNEDFLASGNSGSVETAASFDLVVTNPPYVRTQTLGQERAKELARRFGLTGRIDLYHAFVAAITERLQLGGVLGLLTSNRFMYVQSGKAMRQTLLDSYELHSICDLGDTKFFNAAVLPVVVVGTRAGANVLAGPTDVCQFTRVGKTALASGAANVETECLLRTLEATAAERTSVSWQGGDYVIESGHLLVDDDVDSNWLLRNQESTQFMAGIAANQVCTFNDVAEIKVGIKTTADSVFIRADWEQLPNDLQPEPELLRPLLTHHVAFPWRANDAARRVLYPYAKLAKRTTVDLSDYPRALRYLESHREKLISRKYVVDSGREWFEIWVPQQPVDWAEPKIVWPDIAESARFFLDETGSIVNGDCYWIKLRPNMDRDWLYLMLAVANSNVLLQYYDYRCQNRLYAGRRRFMTQYVKNFPLPDLQSELSRQVVELTKRLLKLKRDDSDSELMQENLQELVRKIFVC